MFQDTVALFILDEEPDPLPTKNVEDPENLPLKEALQENASSSNSVSSADVVEIQNQLGLVHIEEANNDEPNDLPPLVDD